MLGFSTEAAQRFVYVYVYVYVYAENKTATLAAWLVAQEERGDQAEAIARSAIGLSVVICERQRTRCARILCFFE